MMQAAIRAIVENALLEDLGQGDVTTDSFPELTRLHQIALLRVREDCVVSGLMAASLSFSGVDSALCFTPQVKDGDFVKAGTQIATVAGSMASILKAERTALNFLQHLSGIATMTHRYVDALTGTATRITNTRKTTPGLRLLERQAVMDGGGAPHRFNLGSCAMLKDNHIQALERPQAAVDYAFEPDALDSADGSEPAADTTKATANTCSLPEAVAMLRERLSHTMRIEVEADRMDQVQQAVKAGADIILLDNMSPDEIRDAVALIAGRAITEASGRITLDTVRRYAEAGVDYISTSKITLGVPAIDIGLDLPPAAERNIEQSIQEVIQASGAGQR